MIFKNEKIVLSQYIFFIIIILSSVKKIISTNIYTMKKVLTNSVFNVLDGFTTIRIVYLYVVQVLMYKRQMHVHVGQQIPSQAQDSGVDVSGS